MSHRSGGFHSGVPEPDHGCSDRSYSAAKMGLIGFAKTLAREGAKVSTGERGFPTKAAELIPAALVVRHPRQRDRSGRRLPG